MAKWRYNQKGCVVVFSALLLLLSATAYADEDDIFWRCYDAHCKPANDSCVASFCSELVSGCARPCGVYSNRVSPCVSVCNSIRSHQEYAPCTNGFIEQTMSCLSGCPKRGDESASFDCGWKCMEEASIKKSECWKRVKEGEAMPAVARELFGVLKRDKLDPSSPDFDPALYLEESSSQELFSDLNPDRLLSVSKDLSKGQVVAFELHSMTEEDWKKLHMSILEGGVNVLQIGVGAGAGMAAAAGAVTPVGAAAIGFFFVFSSSGALQVYKDVEAGDIPPGEMLLRFTAKAGTDAAVDGAAGMIGGGIAKGCKTVGKILTNTATCEMTQEVSKEVIKGATKRLTFKEGAETLVETAISESIEPQYDPDASITSNLNRNLFKPIGIDIEKEVPPQPKPYVTFESDFISMVP